MTVCASFAIREAVATDLGTLAGLEPPHSGGWRLAQLRDSMVGERGRLWVGDLDGRSVSYLAFWELVDELEVHRIAVAPSFRRNGFGTALLVELGEEALRLAKPVVLLEVDTRNAAARALYRKLGFREVGRRSGYYQGGQSDAILMRADAPLANKARRPR